MCFLFVWIFRWFLILITLGARWKTSRAVALEDQGCCPGCRQSLTACILRPCCPPPLCQLTCSLNLGSVKYKGINACEKTKTAAETILNKSTIYFGFVKIREMLLSWLPYQSASVVVYILRMMTDLVCVFETVANCMLQQLLSTYSKQYDAVPVSVYFSIYCLIEKKITLWDPFEFRCSGRDTLKPTCLVGKSMTLLHQEK